MSQQSLFPFHLPTRRWARTFACCLLTLAASIAPGRAQSSQDPVYVFHTTLGNINVQLFPDVAPKTVANFLAYVNAGAYNNSFIHRSVPSFVIQGGGYYVTSQRQIAAIPANPPVVNEFHLSNVRGTIAMAKLGNDPNSATNEWFFNESDSNASNLDNQNGGFTVFGKITDSASLAVMDKIAAVPTVNEGSPLNELPVLNYQSGQAVTVSQLVYVNSITPAWVATSLSTGKDGLTRLLWDHGDGAADVWSLDAQGNQAAASAVFGPYPDWTARQVAEGPDGHARLLWTNADGRCAVWTLSGSLAQSSVSPLYGPYAGWTAQSLAVAPDGTGRLLWTNSDGRAAVWTLSVGGSQTSVSPYYGPYPGWSAAKIAVGPDGNTRLLWTNADGRADFWSLDAQGNTIFQSPVYGPYTGWTATDLATNPDNTMRALWNNADGRMVEYIVSAGGSVTAYSPIYGPYAGAGARAITVGPDGLARILWDNANLQSVVWTLDSAGSHTGSSPVFGPY